MVENGRILGLSSSAQDYVLAVVEIEKRRKMALGEIYAKIAGAVNRSPDTIKIIKNGGYCGEELYKRLRAYYFHLIEQRMHPQRYRVTAETKDREAYNLVMEQLTAEERFEILYAAAKARAVVKGIKDTV